MNKSSTAARDAEVVRLSQTGATQQAIGAAVGVSQRHVGRILEAAGVVLRRRRVDGRAKPAGAPAAARGRRGKPRAAQAAHVASAATAATPEPVDAVRDDLAALASAVAEAGSLDRLRELAAETRDFTRAARESGNAAVYATLAKLECEIAERVARLTPPATPKPADDANRVRALDILRALVGAEPSARGAA